LRTKYGTSDINLQVVIIGKGSEVNNLQKLSRNLDLQEIVTFKGELRGKELEDWYSVADLFILPSLTEGKPVVIYEAMSSECAVIATNVGGIPDQVKDNHTGLLFEPEDMDALANKIKYLLDNEDVMKKMGENGRKLVINEGWTWEGYAKRINNVYNNLVDK
jgi:glycosyltransferase involved in cell wall biosynthesis